MVTINLPRNWQQLPNYSSRHEKSSGERIGSFLYAWSNPWSASNCDTTSASAVEKNMAKFMRKREPPSIFISIVNA
jgi:hypothetical protein